MERFKFVSTFTRPQKEKMIRYVNPDWVDLTIGLNFENTARPRPMLRPSISAAHRLVTF
jgi:putative endonuclease